MKLRVWFGPGRDHDYGREMDYDTFCALDRAISVEDMARVGALQVGEEVHGKDGDDGERFTARRVADEQRPRSGR